jgi:hypothetical protein
VLSFCTQATRRGLRGDLTADLLIGVARVQSDVISAIKSTNPHLCSRRASHGPHGPRAPRSLKNEGGKWKTVYS